GSVRSSTRSRRRGCASSAERSSKGLPGKKPFQAASYDALPEIALPAKGSFYPTANRRHGWLIHGSPGRAQPALTVSHRTLMEPTGTGTRRFHGRTANDDQRPARRD